MRSRTQFPAENGGLPCQGAFTDSRPCNTNPCAVASPCTWNPWSEWGACNLLSHSAPKRVHLISQLLHVRSWIKCETKLVLLGSVPCGSGTSTRTRSQNAAVNGGAPCVGSSSEVVACNTHACPTPVDCTWNTWSSWSTCSAACTLPL